MPKEEYQQLLELVKSRRIKLGGKSEAFLVALARSDPPDGQITPKAFFNEEIQRDHGLWKKKEP